MSGSGRIRARGDGGFTLIELVVVVAMLAILASIAVGSLQAATTVARSAATLEQLELIRNALLERGMDCGTPLFTGPQDPGLAAPLGSDDACWRGPYLTTWPDTTSLGGTLRYRGRARRPPELRIDYLSEAGAQTLATGVVRVFGDDALARLRRRGGGRSERWSLDVVFHDVPDVPRR